MTKQVVLITSASGFIGTALIARLKKRFYIVGIDKVLHNDRDNSILWYRADISDKKFLHETFCEIKEKVSGEIIVMTKEIVSRSIFSLPEEDYVLNNKIYGLIFSEIYGKHLNLRHLPKWFVRFSLHLINNVYSLSGKSFFFKPWMIDIVDKKYPFNVEKAKEELGWQPRFQLEHYMKVIIENLKNNTHRWLTINNIINILALILLNKRTNNIAIVITGST